MKTKLYPIAIALSLVLVASFAYAATTDFVANENVTVSSVSGGVAPNVLSAAITANLLIMSGSKAESWSYTAGSFAVISPDTSSRFKVGSSDSSVISIRVNNGAGAHVDCADNTTPGTSYVTLPLASDTYNVYGSSSACNAAGSTGTIVGSSGGSAVTPTPVVSVTSTTTATAVVACPAGALFDSNTGKACTAVIATCPPGALFNTSTGAACGSSNAILNPNVYFNSNSTVGASVAISAKLIRPLRVGSSGADVKVLQQFLNKNGFIIASAGVGSPGSETTYFGALTRAAVIRYQIAKGIIQNTADTGTGLVGPKTRATINATP